MHKIAKCRPDLPNPATPAPHILAPVVGGLQPVKVCARHLLGNCHRGRRCPDRHPVAAQFRSCFRELKRKQCFLGDSCPSSKCLFFHPREQSEERGLESPGGAGNGSADHPIEAVPADTPSTALPAASVVPSIKQDVAGIDRTKRQEIYIAAFASEMLERSVYSAIGETGKDIIKPHLAYEWCEGVEGKELHCTLLPPIWGTEEEMMQSLDRVTTSGPIDITISGIGLKSFDKSERGPAGTTIQVTMDQTTEGFGKLKELSQMLWTAFGKEASDNRFQGHLTVMKLKGVDDETQPSEDVQQRFLQSAGDLHDVTWHVDRIMLVSRDKRRLGVKML